MAAQPRDQKSVRAKRLDAHEAAEVDQVDAFQVVQRQLIIEQLCKARDLKVADGVACTHLSPNRHHDIYIPPIVSMGRQTTPSGTALRPMPTESD